MNRNILLVNLGSPDTPEPVAVGRYLREFLMDPFVIDIPWLLRSVLVKLLIVPQRKFKSSKAYKSIWTKEGSPLVINTRRFAEDVQKENPDWNIRWAMRYGAPGLESTFRRWLAEGPESIDVVPLYPQFAKSSTGTCIQVIRDNLTKNQKTKIRVLEDFYAEPEFIEAFSKQVELANSDFQADQILFSFHGLPEHHVKETDLTEGHCLVKSDCCDKVVEVNRYCYRAQSYATAKGLANAIKLRKNDYQVSFQSRLGRRPWIKPYTDIVLEEIAKNKIEKLLVCCPSFVADCLETLEEIGIRAKTDFQSFGGADLKLVPSLNNEAHWVKSFSKMLSKEDLAWKELSENFKV